MLNGAEKYIGRKLNKQGEEYYLDMISDYGFISEQCSDKYGAIIHFDQQKHTITDIQGVKYGKHGHDNADEIPKTAMRQLERFYNPCDVEVNRTADFDPVLAMKNCCNVLVDGHMVGYCGE